MISAIHKNKSNVFLTFLLFVPELFMHRPRKLSWVFILFKNSCGLHLKDNIMMIINLLNACY